MSKSFIVRQWSNSKDRGKDRNRFTRLPLAAFTGPVKRLMDDWVRMQMINSFKLEVVYE